MDYKINVNINCKMIIANCGLSICYD